VTNLMSVERRSAVVIEDDPDIRALLTDLLRSSGFEVSAAEDGTTGIAAALDTHADLVTIDLNLPDLDGLEVCRKVRAASDAYIIVITARPDEIDKLIGLEAGADDYMGKPFSTRELRARINAMMRRPRRIVTETAVSPPPTDRDQATPQAQPEIVHHGDLTVDLLGRVVTFKGQELELTPLEYSLLVTLLCNPRQVWSREALIREVWDFDWVGDDHLVEVHVANLRRKLGDDPRDGLYVKTVRGVGYRLGRGEATSTADI